MNINLKKTMIAIFAFIAISLVALGVSYGVQQYNLSQGDNKIKENNRKTAGGACYAYFYRQVPTINSSGELSWDYVRYKTSYFECGTKIEVPTDNEIPQKMSEYSSDYNNIAKKNDGTYAFNIKPSQLNKTYTQINYYGFSGWYLTEANIQTFDFNRTYDQSVVIFAGNELDHYVTINRIGSEVTNYTGNIGTISYDLAGGYDSTLHETKYLSLTRYRVDSYVKLYNGVGKENYLFNGWYKTPTGSGGSGGHIISGYYHAEQDSLSVTADWVDAVRVNFYYQDYNIIQESLFKVEKLPLHGTKIPIPESKEIPDNNYNNYYVSNWYYNSGRTLLANPEENIDEYARVVNGEMSFSIYGKITPKKVVTITINDVQDAVYYVIPGNKLDIVLEDPEPANGYTFDGWFDENDNEFNPSTAVINNDMNIHAKFTSTTQYKIRYRLGFSDATGGPSTYTVKLPGQSVTLATEVPTLANHRFDGWKRGGVVYQPGDTFDEEITRDVSLYAQWTPLYEMVFEADGGENAPANGIKEHGVVYTLPTQTPSKEGFDFNGWHTVEHGDYQPGNQYSIDATTTFYAKWTKIETPATSYTITFMANGGNGTMNPLILAYGEKVRLTANAFSKDGYEFKEWNTDPNGKNGVSFANEEEVRDLGDTTLYAIFKPIVYLVAFDTDGGTPVNSMPINHGSKLSKPADPFKDGYTFDEWQYEGNAFDFDTPITKSMILKAVWKINEYEVTFNSSGGSLVPSQNVSYGNLVTRPSDPEKAGYTFYEWQRSGSSYSFNTPVSMNMELVAVWNLAEYEITLNAKGGTLEDSTVTITYGSTFGDLLPTPIRDGYDFEGWYYNENYSGDAIKSTDKYNLTNGTTIYAKWSNKTKYTVTFIDRGEIFKELQVEKGEIISSPGAPYNPGYTFDGWVTTENGRTPFAFANTPINEDKTIYAKWSPKKYTLTYNANGGTVTPPSTEVTYGVPVTSLPTPERTGYQFLGWYYDETFQAKANSGDTMLYTGNHTLIARWQKLEFDITQAGDFTLHEGKIVLPEKTLPNSVQPKSGYTIVYKAGNNKRTSDYIATGDTLTISNGSTSVVYTTLVFGDVVPDGEINILDYVRIFQHVKKAYYMEHYPATTLDNVYQLLTGDFYTAANMDKDLDVDLMDSVQIFNIVKGKVRQ